MLHVHCCLLDRECRRDMRSFGSGAVNRLYFNWSSHNRPVWSLIVALAPSGRTQKFDWKTRRYGDKWGWVAFHPPRWWTKDKDGNWLPRRT